ncbi:Peptidase M15 [Luteitalea pratensis]|uniref:Murein endopeptidase K n=1 Tax=Luteitalea pratensis TaxID=1855912 RepID=A0A143PJL1_LUTPR|nr:YcbK family protein [Luteitalea pratensis]AMY08755.1 Peptidase M15 [Luteitalea pratensis]
MDRRHFLRAVATAVPVLAFPGLASGTPVTVGPRVLTFAHLHTAEKLEVEYMDGVRYLPQALSAVNHLLRDFRTGDVHDIDPALLDLLHALHASTGSRRPFEIISGYRSPLTNAMLRSHGGGVASGSLHMEGKAIDIRLADVPLESLRDAALDLRRGGVGYYAASNFVHVDTGRVRRW